MYKAILQLLQSSPFIHSPQITDLQIYGQHAFRVKIRGTVTETIAFQVWLNHNPSRARYAYQLFSDNKSLLRWDNAPNHPDIQTNFPHHFHTEQKQIVPSPLQGIPLQDLPIILTIIEQYIADL